MTSGLTSTEVYCLAIDAKMPEMLYAGTSDGGVFRSADNGDHWQQTNSGLTSQNVWSLAVDPMARGTLYAGTTVGGLFRSTDSGDHWQSAMNGQTMGTVSSIAVSFSTPGTLYAGTGQGYVYRSTDFGAHWQMASTGLANATINSVVLTPMGPEKMYAAVAGSGVFRSVDSGDHWQQVVTGLVPQIRALAVNPGDTRAVYAGVNGGVFRSHDTGDSWEQLPIGGTVNALTIDLKTTSTVYAGTLDGVSGSTDGGDHWQSVLKSDSVYSLAVGPGTPAVVYAGTSSGEVLRSTDAGGHWTKITGGLTCSVVSCLAIGGNTVAFAGTDAGLFRSTDAGDHWQQVTNGLISRSILSVAVDPKGGTTVYVGTADGGVFRSTDTGDHWQQVTNGLTSSTVLSLVIDPAAPTTVYAGTYGAGVFRSTDAGDHWEQLSKGQNVYCLAIDTRGSRDLYAGTGTGALRYSQGWTLTTAVTPDGGGAVTRSPDQALYPNGTVVTLTAVPSPGWRFVSWTGTTQDATSPLKATVVMDADKSVTALFEPTESVPSAPALLSPADGSVVTTTSSTTAQVSLEWKVVGGATSYNFMLGSAKDFSGRILSGQASTTSKTTCDVTAPELSVGTTYYWRVAAVGAGGSSAWSPVFSFTVVQQGQTVTTLTLRLGSSVMTVSGNDGSSSSVTLDAAPVLGAGNRTLVPIRAVAEAMGGVVDWNAATKTATVRVGTNTLELTLGKSVAVFNGSPKQIDADPKVLPLIINGRTMLPLRFVVESLGANVAYDQATKTITITYTKS